MAGTLKSTSDGERIARVHLFFPFLSHETNMMANCRSYSLYESYQIQVPAETIGS